jgi:hypothetical protein
MEEILHVLQLSEDKTTLSDSDNSDNEPKLLILSVCVATSTSDKKTMHLQGLCGVDGQNSYPPTIRKRMDLHLFHHGDSLGSYQSAEQGDYKRLI